MVQIHEAPQSFGSGLIQALAGAGVNVAKGIQQRQSKTALDKLIEEADKGQNPQLDAQGNVAPPDVTQPARKRVNTSAIYDAAIRSGLTPQQATMKVQPYLDQEKFENQRQLQREKFELDRQKSERLSQDKKLEEAQNTLTEQEDWKEIFSDLDSKLEYVGNRAFVKGGFLPYSKAAEEREAFDVAAFQIEKFARAAHTKGALSTKVYESLLSKLPDSSLSEAKNRGRIKEWKKQLLENEDVLNKLRKQTGTEAPKEKLTKDVAQNFLDQAQGDKKEAQRLAAEAGYKW